MLTLAAASGRGPVGGFLALALVFGACYVILSFFFRRIGGPEGGSEKASVGAWFLLAAVVVGIVVATR